MSVLQLLNGAGGGPNVVMDFTINSNGVISFSPYGEFHHFYKLRHNPEHLVYGWPWPGKCNRRWEEEPTESGAYPCRWAARLQLGELRTE